MYEDWGQGAGVVWYEVHGVNAPEPLDLHGCMSPPYGPSHTILRLELVEKGKETILKLSDSTIGKVGACGDGGKVDGWTQLFNGGLKTYVEKKVQTKKTRIGKK
jgi:hypothetical protein